MSTSTPLQDPEAILRDARAKARAEKKRAQDINTQHLITPISGEQLYKIEAGQQQITPATDLQIKHSSTSEENLLNPSETFPSISSSAGQQYAAANGSSYTLRPAISKFRVPPLQLSLPSPPLLPQSMTS